MAMIGEDTYQCDACKEATASMVDLIEQSKSVRSIWGGWRRLTLATYAPNSSVGFLLCPACLDKFRKIVLGGL